MESQSDQTAEKDEKVNSSSSNLKRKSDNHISESSDINLCSHPSSDDEQGSIWESKSKTPRQSDCENSPLKDIENQGAKSQECCETKESNFETDETNPKPEISDQERSHQKKDSIEKKSRVKLNSASSTDSSEEIKPTRAQRVSRWSDSSSEDNCANDGMNGGSPEAALENESSDSSDSVKLGPTKARTLCSDPASLFSTTQASGITSESNEPVVPKTKKPAHNWFLCKEVLNRQYGPLGNRSTDLFRLNCYSSLHMVERLELMYKMCKHEGCVNSVHFNEQGTRLASGSDDLRIVIWDWTISKPLIVYDSGHRSNVFQAKFLPNCGDSHIISCARDGQVRMAELSATGVCKRTRRLAQHHGAVHKLSLLDDSPHSFLSCGEDGYVFEIDVRKEKPEKILYCKENDRRVPLYTIHTNPIKTNEFAIGGRDQYIRIYDKRFIHDSNSYRKFCPHHLMESESKTNVTCLVYNYNGSEILATFNDDDVYTFDETHSDGADFTHRYRGHRNNRTVKGVNYFGPKSEFIISGSDCGNIYFWEHDSEHIVQFLKGDEGGVVNNLEPHPTCPILATIGLDDDIKIWIPSCEEPPKFNDLASTVFSNIKERNDDRSNDSQDAIDGQMLWFVMQQWRRRVMRRGRGEEDESSSTTSSSNPSSNEDEDDTYDPRNIQCYQS